ncbi:transposase [Candidatus Protochlamydia amoebophila]|nr:transposase [Candidatus Protochlamydia amoebophila]
MSLLPKPCQKGFLGSYWVIRGYFERAFKEAFETRLERLATIRSNRMQTLMKLSDKILRKRAIIAKVNDPLKNISQIEQTNRRNAGNFLINRLARIAHLYLPT